MSDEESAHESETSQEEDNLDNRSFIYQDSSSEAEEWDEDTHWVVRDISDVYPPPRGPRYFKFDWDQWKRADNTSHTWEREGSVATQDARRTIRQLDNKRSREESNSAQKSLVSNYFAYQIPEDDNDASLNDVGQKSKKPKFAYLFTEIPKQAHDLFVDAKLEQADRQPSDFSATLPRAENLLMKIRQTRQSQLSDEKIDIHRAAQNGHLGFGRAVLPSDTNRARVKTQNSMQQRMANLKIKEISLPSQSSIPPHKVAGSMPPTPASGASTSTAANSPMRPFQSSVAVPSKPPVKLRQSLQKSWSSIAQRARAASITFSNEVNDDDIPPISTDSFQYLERTYIYEDDVPCPDPSFLHSCDCSPGSCKPETCACQEDSMIFDDKDEKMFMYDSKGLYLFDLNVSSYVFECNEKCSCGPKCLSRVAQKPRNIPVDIFRTVGCGWGVRSSIDIPEGAVLGLYTGTLLKRTAARRIPAEDSRYLCDLDFHEDVIGNKAGYTVDAHACGNWTRFVNHSCDPTCKLYAVIYDSVPELHQPKLALVAKKTILALTEITLDYFPSYGKKGKGKQKVTDSSLECHCEAENCRGYIY